MFNIPPSSWSCLIFLLLLASPPLHAAKLYKWVDEAGTVHFSQNPPNDKNTQREIGGDEVTEVVEPPAVDNSPLVLPQAIDQEASLRTTEKCQALLDELQQYTGADGATPTIVVSREMREARITELQAELDASCR